MSSRPTCTFIGLLRGINVGGHNKLPMKELAALLENLGAEQIQTYIQSGNVVFKMAGTDTAALAVMIKNAIGQAKGFEPEVLVLDRAQFERAVAGNPYPQAEEDPKSVHVFFLAEKANKPDLERLTAVQGPEEDFTLTSEAFYLLAPAGMARSKLASKVERALGVAVTARNWRTVTKLQELAENRK